MTGNLIGAGSLKLRDLGFYGDDVRPKTAKRRLHDVLDHYHSPYKDKFIPVSKRGELFALVNRLARAEVKKALEQKRDPRSLVFSVFYGALIYSMRNSNGDELLVLTHREELFAFHKECISFWWNHPQRDALLALEAA